MVTTIEVFNENGSDLGLNESLDTKMFFEFEEHRLYLTLKDEDEIFIKAKLNEENITALENGLKAFREIEKKANVKKDYSF